MSYFKNVQIRCSGFDMPSDRKGSRAKFSTLRRETAYCWARGHPPWVGKQQTGHQHHKRNLREKNARPNNFQPITRRTVENVSTIYVLSFYMHFWSPWVRRINIMYDLFLVQPLHYILELSRNGNHVLKVYNAYIYS